MLRLPTRWLLFCWILLAFSSYVQGQSPAATGSDSAWTGEALAAGWRPPAGWSGVTPVSLPSYGSCDAAVCDGVRYDHCCCCESIGNWMDNTQVWLGGEAYKSIGDSTQPLGSATDYMNSFGMVAGFNTGFAVGLSRVRGQVGASYGVYDWKGRDTVSVSSLEQQVYFTAGLYKRSQVCCGDRISWGVVYDQFIAHQWGLFADEVSLSQIRGILGYALSDCNEVGLWGTFHLDDTFLDGSSLTVRAMNQANFYWRHNYAYGATTMLYAGAFDQADLASWQFGLLGDAPLNRCLSLYGNFNLVLPSSSTGLIGSNELEWYMGVGVTYSFGGKSRARSVSGQAGLPLLPVANNGSFLVTN